MNPISFHTSWTHKGLFMIIYPSTSQCASHRVVKINKRKRRLKWHLDPARRALMPSPSLSVVDPTGWSMPCSDTTLSTTLLPSRRKKVFHLSPSNQANKTLSQPSQWEGSYNLKLTQLDSACNTLSSYTFLYNIYIIYSFPFFWGFAYDFAIDCLSWIAVSAIPK